MKTLAKILRCPSKEGKHLEAKVSGCPDLSQVCKLARGSNVTISVRFLSETDASQLRLTTAARFFPAVKRLTDIFLDACEAVTNCPVRKGGTYVLNYTEHIPKDVPKFPAKFSYTLRADDHLPSIVCFRFDVNFVQA